MKVAVDTAVSTTYTAMTIGATPCSGSVGIPDHRVNPQTLA